MEFLEKLRGLPQTKRKIILWLVIAIIALVLFILWTKNVRKKFEGFQGEEVKQQFQIPDLPRIETPEIELPQISEEELKELEKELSPQELEELKKLYGK